MTQQKQCPICGDQLHPLAEFCKRCKKLLDRADMRRRPDRAARVKALRSGWDGHGFRCHYTGVRLEETDHHSPRYLTFDHRTPRNESDVVVCAACINDMKSDLSEAEFRAILIQLVSRFQGGDFDESVLELTHWRR